jgi:hypothetical protein
MFIRFSLVILSVSFATIACGSTPLLSPLSNWGTDFTSRSPATDKCPGGSLASLGSHMTVSAPYKLAKFQVRVPDLIRTHIASTDRLYSFQFNTTLASGNYWGFSGYLVARGDCIVHAQVTGYDN